MSRRTLAIVVPGAGCAVLAAVAASTALGTSGGASATQPTRGATVGTVQPSPHRAPAGRIAVSPRTAPLKSASRVDATKGSNMKQRNRGAVRPSTQEPAASRDQAQTESLGARSFPRAAGKRAAQQVGPSVASSSSGQSVEDVAAYWTPERMADAQPMGPKSPSGEGSGDGATPAPSGSTSPGSAPAGD